MSVMQRDEIFHNLNAIFADVLDLDEVELTDSTTANEIEEWDSLSHIRLIVSIEQEYGFKFSTSEIEALKSVGDLVDSIVSKVG